MSLPLISHSADLKQLRDEGFDIEVRGGHLLVKDVPYVAPDGTVKRGTLVSELSVAGDQTIKPNTHVVFFSGDYPCDRRGSKLIQIVNSEATKTIADGMVVNFTFSSKPTSGPYRDYHHKMTTYVNLLASYAEAIDPAITARTFPVVETTEDESVFAYLDTASSRAGITNVVGKLGHLTVAIVGTGGTGSYLLDLVAKTEVAAIHLFDRDPFLNHNAFRSPGAPSIDDLRAKPSKVHYLTSTYSRMRRNIVPQPP